jgi:hypothetical protein
MNNPLRVACPPGPPEYFYEARGGQFLGLSLKTFPYNYLQDYFTQNPEDQEDQADQADMRKEEKK